MTDWSEKLILDLSFEELMRAAALGGYVVGEERFHDHAETCRWNTRLQAYVILMARIGIRRAIADRYDRQFQNRPDTDDLDDWLWGQGCHAFANSEHPGGPQRE
ncbi:MAG TPA: hypothetical protein VGO22_22895 [Pseudorhizobium sp.]|jgi:hypothetical protein|nr:hypothetical protein [Pseudorhizobium sp.]